MIVVFPFKGKHKVHDKFAWQNSYHIHIHLSRKQVIKEFGVLERIAQPKLRTPAQPHYDTFLGV